MQKQAHNVIRKTMYRCEKFRPSKCPHCDHEFRQQNQDWIMYMGTIKDGVKVPDPQYPRIICKNCDGEPIKIIYIKAYQLESEVKIDHLIEFCGYFNKQTVEASGNMTRDHVVDYSKGQPKLEVVKCE